VHVQSVGPEKEEPACPLRKQAASRYDNDQGEQGPMIHLYEKGNSPRHSSIVGKRKEAEESHPD